MMQIREMTLKELQDQILEAALEVHKNMGLGFQETAYSQALAVELDLRKVEYERKKNIKLSYKGSVAGEYNLEFVVNGKIIVMVKAGEPIKDADESKMRSFLKATKLPLGMILDFGKETLEVKNVMR
jgi:GxxExxY protein